MVSVCLDFGVYVLTAITRMRIKKLPNILALHLKRFKYQDEQNRYIKLSYRVAFPFLLEPGNLSSTCQGAENSDRMYSLFAVIIHIGR